MRLTKNEFGISIMVTNEEYLLIKKINARGKVASDGIQEYYQDMAEKLVARGLLNKEEENDEIYFTGIKRST